MSDSSADNSCFKAPTSFLKPPNKSKQEKEKVEEQPKETVEEKTSQPKTLNVPPLEYTPPSWASEPTPGICYRMEILKNGTVIDVQDLEKRKHNPTFVCIGRLPTSDIQMEHPSISRYHCILQYGDDKKENRGKGWYIYDMGSTHGTKMNKNRLPAKQYVRVQVGYVFQFGNSTRICSLLGPVEDAEPEWDCSPTEMKERIMRKNLERKIAAAAQKEFEEDNKKESEEDEGINWGMDYGEDDISTVEFDGENDDEAYYNDDPKKALSKFFERVGFEMNFTYSELGSGHNHKWNCSIELPIEIDGVDRACIAQVTVSTSKKDATLQCALEACRILDRHGVLRGGSTRLKIKKRTLEENDFFEEDDDLYFDRTGQIETQRDKRKIWTLKAMGKTTEEKDTYKTLTIKLEATTKQIDEIQKELEELGKNKTTGQVEDVDDYVNQLAKGRIMVKDDLQTKIHKSQLRQKLVTLTHEAQTLEKLIKITKPTNLPETSKENPESAKQAFLRKMMKYRNVKEELAAKEEKNNTEKEVSNETNNETVSENPSRTAVTTLRNQIGEKVIEKKNTINTVVEPEVLEEKPCSSSSFENSENKSQEAIDDDPKDVSMSVLESRKRIIEEGSEQTAHKKRKPRIRKEKWEDYGTGYENKDEQYATWMPPENQSGDGKTSLHNKFGGKY